MKQKFVEEYDLCSSCGTKMFHAKGLPIKKGWCVRCQEVARRIWAKAYDLAKTHLPEGHRLLADLKERHENPTRFL